MKIVFGIFRIFIYFFRIFLRRNLLKKAPGPSWAEAQPARRALPPSPARPRARAGLRPESGMPPPPRLASFPKSDPSPFICRRPRPLLSSSRTPSRACCRAVARLAEPPPPSDPSRRCWFFGLGKNRSVIF